MAKFDIETAADYCINLLKTNIDAKITEINAEKGDSLLESPTEEQYIEDFSEQVLNYDFFIYNAIKAVETRRTVGSSVSVDLSLYFYACFVDHDGGDTAYRKSLRYVRVFQEIFLENFSNPQISNLEIEQYLPESAHFEKSAQWYKISGIELKGTINL